MSTAAAKNKKKVAPGLATSGRGAALSITLGVTLLTMGLSFLLALSIGSSSYVLQQLSRAARGLGGILSPVLPLLLCWIGIKLMVSSRHKVAARDVVLMCCIYLLVLCCFTLMASVRTGNTITSYMDHLGRPDALTVITYSPGYFTYLQRSYDPNLTGHGGLLGMLLAYPFWKLFTRIGGFILALLLLLICFFMLFRINPGEIFRQASDAKENRRIRRLHKKQQQAAQQQSSAPPPSPSQNQYPPPEQLQPGQQVYREQYEYRRDAAPRYEAAPIYQASGFYPVTTDLRDERYPLHVHKNDGAMPAQARAVSPLDELEAYPQDDSSLYPEQMDALYPNPKSDPAPSFSWQQPAPEDQTPPVAEPIQDTWQEEELPWDEEPAPTPSPAKIDLHPKTEEAKPAEKPAPQDSSWLSQVRKKKADLSQEMPEHTTRKGEPKPVYTDPVMPITGEKISIPSRKEPKEDRNTRLDGTTPPKVRQTKMDMPLQYQAPPIRLLNEAKRISQADAAQEDEYKAKLIEQVLKDFKVDCRVMHITRGPSITRFAIQIAPGILVSKVFGVGENLALELKVPHVRIETHIQGTNYIGIEVPNSLVNTVSLREVLDSAEMRSASSPLLVALGKDIAGTPVLCDLSKMPHLLIAGATGSGKSVCINSIICSLIYRTSPDQVRMIMIDPKQVELNAYNSIPHLLLPVISDPRKAAGALAWVVQEMMERYGKFSAIRARHLEAYNKAKQGTDEVLPNIVVIIDEMADLMDVCRKDVEESIRRLAALARAAGIYLVFATQRPSVDVITGVVKNNIPSRIAFAVSSGTDSRTIIDGYGAEKLMGKGDMLYKPSGSDPKRVQGCLVTDDEVTAITDYIASRYETNYDPDIAEQLENASSEKGDHAAGGEDEAENKNSDADVLRAAIEMAVEDGSVSVSGLQRVLRLGHGRAGRIVDEMEKRGIVSRSEGSKPRKTLITREQYYEMFSDE